MALTAVTSVPDRAPAKRNKERTKPNFFARLPLKSPLERHSTISSIKSLGNGTSNLKGEETAMKRFGNSYTHLEASRSLIVYEVWIREEGKGALTFEK